MLLLAATACGTAQARGTTHVTLDIHYSRFSDSMVTVRRGVPVTFVVRNADPIGHELIVGDHATQERHRTGTEPQHGERPTEVDVPAGETVTTTITFADAGTQFFACHLPGHYDYGMRGLVRVVP